MTNPANDSNDEVLPLDFDRRLSLPFRGSLGASEAGLLAQRELDGARGRTRQARCSPTLEPTKVTEMITSSCHDNRVWASCRLRRRRRRRAPVPRSDDAPDRGGKTAISSAASARHRRRFETKHLAAERGRLALASRSGQWIGRVHGRRPPKGVFLGMDSSVSPTHGEQKNGV
jgi:hypothetical protein